MTYLIPDDWYANHCLPPGVAKGPQPILEPRPGNSAPLPPIRGYFGVRPKPAPRNPMRTRSPWAVSDSMYGLGADPNKIMSDLQEDLKQEMMRQAAMASGITIALNFVPVVGQAAALVFSVVHGLVGSKYQREAQEIVADTQIKANQIGSEYEVKLQTAQNQIFLQEKDAAMALALSCANQVAAMNGLSGFSIGKAIRNTVSSVTNAAAGAVNALANPFTHLSTVIKPVGKVVKMISPSIVDEQIDKADALIDRAEAAVDQQIDTLTGARQLELAKEARTKVLTEVRKVISERYAEIIAEMDTQNYRENLRKTMAGMLLANAAVTELAKQRCSMQGGPAPSITNPLTESAKVPSGLVGAAAAGVTLLLMFSLGE